jgi:hypothetical protein
MNPQPKATTRQLTVQVRFYRKSPCPPPACLPPDSLSNSVRLDNNPVLSQPTRTILSLHLCLALQLPKQGDRTRSSDQRLDRKVPLERWALSHHSPREWMFPPTSAMLEMSVPRVPLERWRGGMRWYRRLIRYWKNLEVEANRAP